MLFSHVLSELYSVPLYDGRTSHTHRSALACVRNPRIASAYPMPIIAGIILIPRGTYYSQNYSRIIDAGLLARARIHALPLPTLRLLFLELFLFPEAPIILKIIPE